MFPERNKLKLSLLFFFQFCILGGVVPVLSLYLKGLPGFTGSRIGFVLSMTSIASVTSPLIAERIAGRYISADRLYSILHILCGVLLIVFRQQTEFISIMLVYLFLMISLSPTSTLLNVLVFHSLGREKAKYGFLRVWGTVGWIFMAVFFSYIWLGSDLLPLKRDIGDLYYITAFFSFFLGFYSLFLHNGRTEKRGSKQYVKLDIKSILSGAEGKELFYFIIISMLASVADKTYFLGIAPFLKFSGFSESSIMPAISIGMIPEVAAMFILYRLIKKIGYKNILTAGMTAHIIRFTLFILSSETGALYFIIPGIFMHGLTFAFFIAVSYIFLDTFCSSDTRSSMHLLYAFVVAGTGNLAGNIIGGVLMDISIAWMGNYTLFWLFPAAVSYAAFLLLRRKISSR